ncbi:hypothetical protein [Streptomyces sp. NPDC087538]|uniref:hypothetical protein n=1 Tax=unclassified Streptomyces TaxID=2593676 RepID=UPI003820E264
MAGEALSAFMAARSSLRAGSCLAHNSFTADTPVRPDRGQSVQSGRGEGVDESGDGRIGGHRTEHCRLGPQHPDIGQTVPTERDAAYQAVRRRNVARHLLARLNREGRGTRVEIHPLNQSQVARPLQRMVEYRTMNVRRWDRIVEAWAAGDVQGLDDEWTTDVLPDLGSQWGQYEYVTNIGFAA